jgi:hypothetical protein
MSLPHPVLMTGVGSAHLAEVAAAGETEQVMPVRQRDQGSEGGSEARADKADKAGTDIHDRGHQRPQRDRLLPRAWELAETIVQLSQPPGWDKPSTGLIHPADVMVPAGDPRLRGSVEQRCCGDETLGCGRSCRSELHPRCAGCRACGRAGMW